MYACIILKIWISIYIYNWFVDMPYYIGGRLPRGVMIMETSEAVDHGNVKGIGIDISINPHNEMNFDELVDTYAERKCREGSYLRCGTRSENEFLIYPLFAMVLLAFVVMFIIVVVTRSTRRSIRNRKHW